MVPERCLRKVGRTARVMFARPQTLISNILRTSSISLSSKRAKISNAGIVDEHVDASEAFQRGLDGAFNVFGLGHVELQEKGIVFMSLGEVFDLRRIAGGNNSRITEFKCMAREFAAKTG